MRICKSFGFDAAHRLDRLPSTHKCFNVHGHTYRVEIEIDGPVNTLGMVVDYADIADAWAPLHAILDHHYLNDIPELEIPTTEMLVEWLLKRLYHGPSVNGRRAWGPDLMTELAAIRVYESATTWAERRLMR